MTNLSYLVKSISVLRKEIDKKDVPATWLEFFLLVAEAGEAGITTKEVSERVGVTQGVGSRTVKLLSQYYNHTTGETDGLDLLVTVSDQVHRHRQRVLLSEKGKGIIAKVS